MIDAIVLRLETLQAAARALIGKSPRSGELLIQAARLARHHDLAPGTWIRGLMPAQSERGGRPIAPVRYVQVLELGGRSFAQLPATAGVVDADITVEQDLRRQGLLRRYLQASAANFFSSPQAAMLPLGEYQRRIQNALDAANRDRCADTLEQLRDGLNAYLRDGGRAPTFFEDLKAFTERERHEYKLDAHMPAAGRIIGDLTAALRAHANTGAVAATNATEALDYMVAAFVDESAGFDGVGARVASAAAQRGHAQMVDDLLTGYRNETSRARAAIIAAETHAEMGQGLFEAMPNVLAADLLAKMTREMRSDRKSSAIANQTDEELVRFGVALVTKLRMRAFSKDSRDQTLLASARVKGQKSLDLLIEHWRSSFTFSDPMLRKIRAEPRSVIVRGEIIVPPPYGGDQTVG